ncbi:MAG: hypothetical protein ACYSXF_10075, partial [Planctomycetota bacterium]
RLLRDFDFEEAEAAPHEMPINFYRFIEPDDGFPPFGRMRLTDEAAFGGNWSFGFELEGGSLSARVPTAVLPVLPMADYAVSVRVRTSGLTHARARLVAWFHDAEGRTILESKVYSRPIRTEGDWALVSVQVAGDFANATDLVIELQLVQPRQFASRDAAGGPLVEDVTGAAWFDDVNVWHVPRLELRSGSAANVLHGAGEPQLEVLVRDLTNEDLVARLRILDLDGESVYDTTFPAPRSPDPTTVAVPLARHGWFRGVLEVRSNLEVVGRRQLDFVWLAASQRPHVPQRHPFGVVVTDVPAGSLDAVAEAIRYLDVGSAVIPVWQGAVTAGKAEAWQGPLRPLIEKLLDRGTDVTFALVGVPASLARDLGIARGELLDLFSQDPQRLRPYLGEMLMSFGLRARSWQIGATGSPDAVRRDDLAELVDAATRSLGDFVPDPTILIPCTAEQLVDATEALPGYHIAVPYHVQPDALGSYAAEWPVGRRELLVTFDLLPLDQYTPRQQLTDMALRVLHAWRAGLPRLAIKSPWSWHGERGSLLPDPASAVWPHLAARLSGRRFGGELALADGVHCWILEGSAPDDAALVAWNAWMSPGEQPVIRARLAAGPIEVVDIFGNITRVGAREGLHTVPLSEVPVFMEGVNVNLAKFRAGFVIDPDFVPSQSRSHDHEIVLSNPWDVLVSGTIRLVETDRWRISPRVQSFVIRPDQEVRLPIDILFDGRPLAGRSHIVAEVDLVADRDYRLRVQAELEVGLEGIEFLATWSVVR